MSDLISRQALKNALTNWQMEYAEKGKDVERFETLGAVIELVERLPTIDAVPREDYEATIYAREQNAYDRGLTDGRKEQPMTSGYVTTVSDLPPVEYAPVVRRKDCRWKEEEQPGMVYCPATVGGWVDEEWFCKGGERSEDGQT